MYGISKRSQSALFPCSPLSATRAPAHNSAATPTGAGKQTAWRTPWTISVACLACLCVASLPTRTSADTNVALDVNDLSILWPVPKTPDDVANLLSIDGSLADGIGPILPRTVFDKVLSTAQTVSVTDSAGFERRINFAQFKDAFLNPATWKIAGIRIDPSAPGTSPMVVNVFGSTPQLRLILQPVTVAGQTVKVHDTTMHVVFGFLKRFEHPSAQGPPVAIPDNDKFLEIISDLAALKIALKDAGITTDGKMSVHPALVSARQKDFTAHMRSLLKKHVTPERLLGAAFMGIDPPEPWIFVAFQRSADGDVALAPNQSIAGKAAQMLIMRGGIPVMPAPTTTTNLDAKRGISTSLLFPDQVGLARLSLAVFPDAPTVLHRDIPDAVANPQRCHFFNTDCLSCHSESTRRARLGIPAGSSAFSYQRPVGVSGVDESCLPKSSWNVRNFGWGPESGSMVPTITMRTANETAESVDFINKQRMKGRSKAVANPLTLVMTIKSPQDFQALKALIEGLQKLPDDQNPIRVALTKIGTVHFARFVFLSDSQLAIITTYDGDFETYVDAFVNELAPVFDKLFAHMKDAPPLPISEHRKEFLDYVKTHDIKCVEPSYSAYPDLKVLDILTLQKSQAKP
jgi:hypothetical protein